MPKGFFITGTDTGVGKTFVSAVLVRALNSLGLNTAVMKPIETGCLAQGGELVPSDGLFLKEVAGIDEPLSMITPCRFESPLAPMAAAEIESASVNIEELRKRFGYFTGKYQALIVEGVGGLMVPVRDGYYVSDLAGEFRLPLIIVARPGLGTVNHIMLTVDHAAKRGLRAAGIILNYTRPPENSLSEETNPDLLRRICNVPLLGVFPYMQEINRDVVERIALEQLDLDLLKKNL